MWIWYLDRGSALVAYAALWLSVLTGIGYNARALGFVHRAARATHVSASVIACATLVLHVVVGVVDSWLVFAARVPHPEYSFAYFGVGLFVGVVALLVLTTATLAFLDPKKFERPWDPRTVHLFSYGGFAFATFHAIALGTDLYGFVKPGIMAATALLVYALLTRFVSDRLSTRPKAPAAGPRSGP